MRDFRPKMVLGKAFIFILCSCIQADYPRNSPQAMDRPAKSPQVACMESAGYSLERLPADFKETSEKVVHLEKALDREEGARVSILANLARLCFASGETAKKDERLKWYEKGRYYAEILCREEPQQVEGWYWLSLNLCGICELSGAGKALTLVPTIVEKLEFALSIDENYDQGGPPRVLGRIRCQAPPWPLSEGDINQSLVLLRMAAKSAPDNSTNHLYLAKTLIELGDAEEACMELDRALSSKSHAFSPSGLNEDRDEASALIAKCGSRSAKNVSTNKNIPEEGRSFAKSLIDAAKNRFPGMTN